MLTDMRPGHSVYGILISAFPIIAGAVLYSGIHSYQLIRNAQHR